MCLILLVLNAHPDTGLLLAGNRDEFYARPSAPPALISQSPRIHAGTDLEAGGTWMGRNQFGLVAALTNRRDPTGHEPSNPRSRGEIVLSLLSRADPRAAARWLEEAELARYRPFNVLFGTAERFFYFSSQEGGPPRALPPGFYALSNATLDDRSWPKVERCHRFFDRNGHLPGESFLLALQAFLCDPTPPDALPSADRAEEIHGSLGAVFINTPSYGTVSSSIICQGGTLGSRYYFSEAEAMRKAQTGWAREAFGNGGGAPPTQTGSPFRLLDFGD